MASTRFKGLIATQLARLTGGDAAVIARAIDRPKIKGHGTFALLIPRLLSASDTLKKTTTDTLGGSGIPGTDKGALDTRVELLSRIQREV